MDAKGTVYNGVITLTPYTSAVLIKSGAATYQPPTATAGANQTITLPNNPLVLLEVELLPVELFRPTTGRNLRAHRPVQYRMQLPPQQR